MKNIIVLIFLLFMLSSASAQFEQNVQSVTITMKDGTVRSGILISSNEYEIFYRADGNIFTVLRSDIDKIELEYLDLYPKDKFKSIQKYSENYFIVSSALPAGKGNMSYRNYDLIVHQFSIGLTENFTLTAGFETISIFVDESFPAVYIGPKYSFRKDDVHFSIGSIATFNEVYVTGFHFINTTIGGQNKNITAGILLGYSTEGDFSVRENYAISLGTNIDLNHVISFVGEMALYQGREFLISNIGVRHTRLNGVALDFGITSIEGLNSKIPLVGITVPFGGK